MVSIITIIIKLGITVGIEVEELNERLEVQVVRRFGNIERLPVSRQGLQSTRELLRLLQDFLHPPPLVPDCLLAGGFLRALLHLLKLFN